jgi:hypothetical protein
MNTPDSLKAEIANLADNNVNPRMAAPAHGVSGLLAYHQAIYYGSTPPGFRLEAALFKTFPAQASLASC